MTQFNLDLRELERELRQEYALIARAEGPDAQPAPSSILTPRRAKEWLRSRGVIGVDVTFDAENRRLVLEPERAVIGVRIIKVDT